MVNMVKILRLYIFKQFVLQFQALDPKQLIQNFWKDIANEMTGFYMKCKTELKCVKAICPSRHIPVHIYKWRHQINEFNVLTKPVKVTPPPPQNDGNQPRQTVDFINFEFVYSTTFSVSICFF